MTERLHQITDRALLKAVAAHEGSFQSTPAILEGLTEEQATAKPHGLPHSIAEIVSHMLFWQEFIHQAVDGRWAGVPEHAADGWPPVVPGGWERLRLEFLESCRKTETLAESSPRLEARLLPEGIEVPALEHYTVGSGLLQGAVHTAHHLGQIVTMRQLMGLWPPPAGSMTW